ncbi:MAG TPA: cation transporter [Clostridia bacterium]|nr:cation transporter [Clostridia bacterium]
MISGKEKRERTILGISLWANVAFAVIEIVMSIVTGSQAVLMDAAVDSVELIVVASSLLIAPLLYRPPTEKRPYGYYQVESLFIVIRGFMLLGVAVSLVSANLGVMISGGRHIDAPTVAVYEVALGVMSLAVFLVLTRYNKKLYSPMVQAEIYAWKVDFIISFALGAAFTLPTILGETALAKYSVYFDQIVAIALSLCIMPRPVKMIVGALKSILLFSPKDEKRLDIDRAVAQSLEAFGFQHVFTDVTQTGRKIWLEVTFAYPGEALETRKLRALYETLGRALSERYEGIDIELIPLWEESMAAPR